MHSVKVTRECTFEDNGDLINANFARISTETNKNSQINDLVYIRRSQTSHLINC